MQCITMKEEKKEKEKRKKGEERGSADADRSSKIKKSS
jgi:hypothetical protein